MAARATSQWRGLNSPVQKQPAATSRAADGQQNAGQSDGGQVLSPAAPLDARGDAAGDVPAGARMWIGSLIESLHIQSSNLTGKLSLSGEFSGTRIDADDFRRHWQGQAQLQMADTRTRRAELPAAGAAGRGTQHQQCRRAAKITTMPPAWIRGAAG